MLSPSTEAYADRNESVADDSIANENTGKEDSQACTDVPVLRRAAMDYLARREHSFFELTQKLQKRFADTDADLLHEVVTTLQQENLQSDARFAESYARYRTSRGFAYQHIKADLSARRVSDKLIDTFLDVDAEHWQHTADQLICKKHRDAGPISYGSKVHRKLSRFLESRGFTPLQIRKALEKHLD